jgi:hypothetical protein
MSSGGCQWSAVEDHTRPLSSKGRLHALQKHFFCIPHLVFVHKELCSLNFPVGTVLFPLQKSKKDTI